jgi:hypothetical protein
MGKESNILKISAFGLAIASFLFVLMLILAIWNLFTGFGEYFLYWLNHTFYFYAINPYGDMELFQISAFDRYIRNLLTGIYLAITSVGVTYFVYYLYKLAIFLLKKKITISFSIKDYIERFSFKSRTMIVTAFFCFFLLIIELFFNLADIGQKFIEIFRSIHPNPFIRDKLVSISLELSAIDKFLAASLDMLYTIIDSIILCLSLSYLYEFFENLLISLRKKISSLRGIE